MAKCVKCGRKGLFFKVGKDGLCANCRAEHEHEHRLQSLQASIGRAEEDLARVERKRSDAAALLDEAMAAAREEAQRRIMPEIAEKNAQKTALIQETIDLTARRDALTIEVEKVQKSLNTLVSRSEKLKPLANSIMHASNEWMNGDAAAAALSLERLRIDQLLPDLDLNCLSMKQLRSKYNALRKQIVEVCTSYESRYTTKGNAAIYRLMVLALEAELENILNKLQFGKLDSGIQSVRNLTAKYYAIGADGNQHIAPTLQRFIGQIESLYLEIVATEYEYYVQRERAREEQRAIKEQMRQEAEERKRLEQDRKKVEAEEKKYQQEIARLTEQMQQAHDEELEKLRKRLEEMNALMNKVEEKKAEIITLQNGKAGTVYIISNIGAFGDDVFKIGMTRRQDPQDRVNELGDASVPFPFDVHSFIFSQDAVALETALHHELNDRRVNKVNLRKEFFRISIDELQALVERIDPTAPFKVTALAEQYRQSLSITDVPDSVYMPDDDDCATA